MEMRWEGHVLGNEGVDVRNDSIEYEIYAYEIKKVVKRIPFRRKEKNDDTNTASRVHFSPARLTGTLRQTISNESFSSSLSDSLQLSSSNACNALLLILSQPRLLAIT